MLKSLHEQAATRQQYNGKCGLDNDERLLEPMAARASCATPSFTQPVRRGELGAA